MSRREQRVWAVVIVVVLVAIFVAAMAAASPGGPIVRDCERGEVVWRQNGRVIQVGDECL